MITGQDPAELFGSARSVGGPLGRLRRSAMHSEEVRHTYKWATYTDSPRPLPETTPTPHRAEEQS